MGLFLAIRINKSSNSNGDKSYNIVKRSLIEEFILVIELTEEAGIAPLTFYFELNKSWLVMSYHGLHCVVIPISYTFI